MHLLFTVPSVHPLKVNISSIALLLSFRNSLNDLLNQGQAGFCWCRPLSRLTVEELRALNINNNFISLDKQRKIPQLKDFHQKFLWEWLESRVQIHSCVLSVICWRWAARGFATQTQAELWQSTNTEGSMMNVGLRSLFYLTQTRQCTYLSHWPFETSGPNHLTFEQSDTCSVTFEDPVYVFVSLLRVCWWQ